MVIKGRETLQSLAHRLEAAITEVMTGTHKNHWVEDHLTFSWLAAAARILDGQEVRWRGEGRVIQAKAFKLKGKIEHEHGDVAVLMNIKFADGDSLQGVGFLEAKARDWDHDKFAAIKKTQLEAQYKKTRNPKMVLYDREQISFGAGCADHGENAAMVFVAGPQIMVRGSHPAWPSRSVTHAAVLPMDLMMQKSRQNRGAYKFACPLSCQLAHRYLLGLDLELDPKVIATATAFAERQNVSTSVLSIGVSVGGTDRGVPPLEPGDGFLPIESRD